MQLEFENKVGYGSYPTGHYMGVPPQPPRGHVRMPPTMNRPLQQYSAVTSTTFYRFPPPTTTAARFQPLPIRQTARGYSRESFPRANLHQSIDQTTPRRSILKSPATYSSSDERSSRQVKFSEDVTLIQQQRLKGDGVGSRPRSMRVGRHEALRSSDQRPGKYNAVAGTTYLQYDNGNVMSNPNGRASHVSQVRAHESRSARGSRNARLDNPRHGGYVGNGPYHQTLTFVEDDTESMITHTGGRRRTERKASGSGSARRPFIVGGGQKEATRRRPDTEHYFNRNRNGSREVNGHVNREGRKYHDTYETSNDRVRSQGSRRDHAIARQLFGSSRYQQFARVAGRERTRYH